MQNMMAMKTRGPGRNASQPNRERKINAKLIFNIPRHFDSHSAYIQCQLAIKLHCQHKICQFQFLEK